MPDQVTFKAELQDNVTPNLQKLEKQLKQMGMSPAQIKMTLTAVDNATPKVKQAQEQIDKLPKQRMINIDLDIKSGIAKAKEELQKAREEFAKPITVPFNLVDQDGHKLSDSMEKLFNVRSKVALPLMGSLPGANLLYGVGMGAGVAGAVTGASGAMQQSFKLNDEDEQALEKLTVALRSNAGATEDLNKVIAASSKTPFTFQQNLQADIIGRSFQMPMFPGENKAVPQGYLKMAGNMAAAMGTSPDDAMMALAMARQHQYRRLQLYGMRMTQQDFGAGGRFAGENIDQALQQATRRFGGAMEAQMSTFSGMMSNIKDVMSQQVIKPIGTNLFQAVKTRTSGVEETLGSPQGQERIGKMVEGIQHFTTTAINDLAKMKDYFDTHLKQPIDNVIQAMKSLSTSFATAFGATTVTALKAFSEALMGISGPISNLVKDVPIIGTLAGYMKGMQMMGMGGTVRPLQTLTNSLNPNSPQGLFSGMGHSLLQLPGMAVKTGGFLILKDILDAHKAASDMNDQFKNARGELDHINDRASTLAMSLGTSATNMKNLVAAAAAGIPTGVESPRSRANLALHLGAAGTQISRITGGTVTGTGAIQAIEQEMKAEHNYTITAMKDFGSQLIQAAAVAKQFGNSWSEVQRIMTTFAGAAGPIGLGGPKGAPSLIALSDASNRFGVTPAQQQQGWYTPDAVLKAAMENYRSPSIENLRAIPQGQLNKYWNFGYRPGAVGRYGQDSTMFGQQAAAGAALQNQSRAQIGQLAPSALTGQYAVPQVPNIWQQQHLGVNFNQFMPGQTGDPGQAAEKLKAAWSETTANVGKAQQALTDWGATVEKTQNNLDQLNQAQASVNLKMQEFQHTIQLQQRTIEDASLVLQEYTFKNLQPLTEEMTRLQNRIDIANNALAKIDNTMSIVNHTMSDAQYNMTKFADGLLTGEQAALNQLHALSLYNEQLNYLKMQYTQIGAQLGTQVYQRGYSARVQPLMGLSLEMQMQQLQRRQQLAQSQYDITYGEGHYQMQQAQRSLWQRTEMPLNRRLTGITQNQGTIDRTTIQAHNLSETQFAMSQSAFKLSQAQFNLQEKMFAVNQVIQKQQDHITALQINLTKLQQSPAMRGLEDQQYNLGQAIGKANIELTNQNNILSQWQNTVDNLKSQQQDLEKLFDAMLIFSGQSGGPGQYSQDRKMVGFAQQTGIISPKEAKSWNTAIDQAEKAAGKAKQDAGEWWRKQDSVKDVIIAALIGFFTGDLWRKLADMTRHMPLVGGVASTAFSVVGTLAPIVTSVATMLIMGGTVSWMVKRALLAVAPEGALRVAGNAVSKVGEVGLRVSRGRFGSTLAEASGAEGMKNLLSGTLAESIYEKFKPFIHPFAEFRTNIGRAFGAGVGHATGIPGASALLGWAGGLVGKNTEAKEIVNAGRNIAKGGREIAATPSKLGRHVKSFGGHVSSQAKDFKVIIDRQEVHLREAKDIIKKDLGGKVAEFGEHVGEKKGFGKFVGLIGGHIGRFGGFVGKMSAIVTAIDLFKTVIEHFQGWFGDLVSHIHLPGVPKGVSDAAGPASDAPRVGSDAGKVARQASDLYKSNPAFRKTVDAARKAGATAIKWGGRVLRFGGYAAGALSFIPAAESLVAGDVQKGVGQGANAATYFLPGLGEARAFNDLLQGTGVLPTTTPGGPEGRISTPTSGVTAAVQHFLGGGGPSHSVNRPLRTDATPSYNESNTAASINASVMIDNNVIPVAYKKGENYYADEIKSLQQYLSTHKNLSKKAYQDITNQINNDRKKQNDVQQQWYKTDRQHQQAYEQLSAADQIQAQTWALNGPNGLVNYLDTINTHLNSHWSSRLKGTQTAYTNENAAHNIGYKSISGTTGHWLGSLKSQIDGWSKQMGLPLSDTAKPGHVTTSGQGVGSAASSAVSAVSTAISVPANLFGGKEHGGLVELEKHHQLGHGRMVRMVEEGHPEMVIPLAPHRRDHAKNLLKHTTSLLGMEHGGVVHKDHHRRIRENIPKIKPLVNKAGQIVKHGDIRAPGFATGGYVWPYGPGITSGRIDEGWDMGGTGPIAAIGNTGPLMQGQPGWPGTGQGFYYQLKDGIRAGQYVYVYENVQRLKPLGYQAKAGEILANLLSGYPYLESGWATSSGAPTSQGQYSDGTPMPQGYDFQRFLTGLQHGQLIGGGEGGAGIPAPKLKLPPALLKKMGIVGPRQFAILNKWLKNWQTSLNTRADTGGTAGSTAGLSGPLKTMVGQIAQRMSWDGSQVQDWLRVISMESNGTITDTNPSSGAYGIAQMLAPGGSPTNLGPNKQKYYMYGGDPNTMAGQLLGMANYIKQTYQNPANALAFHLAHNWYAGGIPRVPRDNTPAILHQDEMVIPAAMAHAARAQAGQGHPMMQHGTLKGDPGWLNFEKNYMKHLTSILVIQDDIHRVRKHMDNFDQGNKKATGQDTAMLRNLNAALRAARARQLGAHNPSTNAAISHALRSIHDPSGGESTLAGVTTEKAHYNRMVYNYTHSSPALVRAQTKLHRDQTHLHAAHSHLTQVQHQIAKHHGHITQGQRRTLAGIHKTITREQKAVRLDQASVHKIQDALKKNVGRETQHAQAAYIVQAATRGINAGLMKSITGKKLTSQETRQYQKLANATAHGADKNSKAVKAMEKQLTKELLSTTKQQVAGHKKTQTTVGKVHKAVGDSVANTNKNHSDVKAHHTKHENHMKKTEDHHKKMEARMDALLRKPTTVNIVNNITGATVKTTRMPQRARSR